MIYLMNNNKRAIISDIENAGYTEIKHIRIPKALVQAVEYEHIETGEKLYLNIYTQQTQSIHWTTEEFEERIVEDKKDRKPLIEQLMEDLENYSYNLSYE
ncbi:hypothetical protein [Turicibacter sanguinis]|uniref:hypothetical protein n=1 Tax=Turicibacter sanguinis TaxID=154288 RepID=UPI0018A8EBAF|nr:hypothetical protein [Turicibacter sanguinis]MCU7190644.1 hypothetical protein [Turicibacter sanguinis]